MEADKLVTIWGVFQQKSHVHRGDNKPAIPVIVLGDCAVMDTTDVQHIETMKEVCVYSNSLTNAIEEPGKVYAVTGVLFDLSAGDHSNVHLYPREPARALTDAEAGNYRTWLAMSPQSRLLFAFFNIKKAE